MTQVKICGMTTPGAVDAAIEAGADYLGFVIFNKSPRHLEFPIAQVLSERANGRVKTVALVVDPDDALLEAVISSVNPDILQLHGNETPQRVRDIKAAHNRPVWKAVSVATIDDVASAAKYAGETSKQTSGNADLILYDAKPPPRPDALPGGNGLAFDWQILSATSNGSTPVTRPFILAGGLTPLNVAEAIKLLDPHIVDVSSSVESAPGTKDPELVDSFIRAAKTANQS